MKYQVTFVDVGTRGKEQSKTFSSESARDTFLKNLKARGGRVKSTSRKP